MEKQEYALWFFLNTIYVQHNVNSITMKMTIVFVFMIT